MSDVAHFLTRERLVTLGGRRLGPFTFGAGRYRVASMTLLRWDQWWRACVALGKSPGGDILSSAAPVEALRVLLPLLVSGPVAQRHVDQATVEQIATALTAAAEVTDFAYLIQCCTPQPAAPDEAPEGLGVAVALVAKSQSCRPRDVLSWPAEEFFAYLEATAEPAPTPEGRELAGKLTAIGIDTEA
ncbi:MAG: hypothetical protein PHU75_03865 [Candidatus Nanopelagicales bacterium]|nr:hypothetical protein [Candidatus Nanopelagicales bacterium]